MKIRSEPFQHTEAIEEHPGGYQWWYFDAGSASGKYHFVVIFYRGNPFSTRYITALESRKGSDLNPSEYPGISMSVYEDGIPIYYSFAEFEETDCTVLTEENKSQLKIGPHCIEMEEGGEGVIYTLHLEEQLPCGDELDAQLQFKGHDNDGTERSNNTEDHFWDLVLPRAKVEGTINLSLEESRDREISFSGMGYHDQNAGREPLKDTFDDWYWGRFHFPSATLIYYVMNQVDGTTQSRAWLLHPDTNEVMEDLQEISLGDKSWSAFGLRSSRKLRLRFEQSQIQVQQSALVDNGPFYQRFLSEAFLSIPAEGVLESTKGISEYIYPERIHRRMFWPLVNMRIRQASGKPHWVQRWKRLYRWTW